MSSIQSTILIKITAGKRGKIIFPSDFSMVGSDDAIRQALSRLAKEKKLIRLAHGIYLYPKIDPELGVLFPPVETIAEAIARRDKARIIPTGVQALNRLGLSTQIPLKAVFMTDGAPRTIRVGKRTIVFQKTSPKMLSIQNELLAMLITAFQELGKEAITRDVISKIKKIITPDAKEEILKEINIAPAWIEKIIKNTLNDNNTDEKMVKLIS
jgi:hypothetical protein